MADYIYSMVRARKAVGDKVILDDVTMSFLPGAKIGVVGPNGAGKSTILKIMAGLDTPSNGEARLSPGYSVGILMQEPELDENKTVYDIAVAYGLTIGENVVQQLVAAGFNKADMEITPNETAIGERVDSIIFSVRFKGECLIGQILPGDYSVSLAPMLGTGFCLVGTTRPIDF